MEASESAAPPWRVGSEVAFTESGRLGHLSDREDQSVPGPSDGGDFRAGLESSDEVERACWESTESWRLAHRQGRGDLIGP